ncbi:MAG: DUF5660 domain-containing protein [Candidatus Shapirobacteria bacterium]|nr:DUF5660 domain-containing protein [Candidatus Shapirobacteria bacterium]
MASNYDPKQQRVTSDSLNEKFREGDFSPKNTSEEEKILQQKLEKFQQNRYQEQIVFNQENQTVQAKIKGIVQELKSLAQSIKKLDKEIDKAIETVPAQAGIYHLNFLEKIREALMLMKKNVENASSWLEVFNQKSAKKHGYWQQYKKSGTQWSLSNERNVATSVG